MATYEYKTITPSSSSEMSKRLNRLGAEGWRLVPVNAGISGTNLIMEREIPEVHPLGDYES